MAIFENIKDAEYKYKNRNEVELRRWYLNVYLFFSKKEMKIIDI